MSDYEFTGEANDTFTSKTHLTPWEAFANHRGIVTGFIKSSVSASAHSLCVLGAGRCNDIDLSHLVREFDELTLVDIDRELIDEGLAQQQVTDNKMISILEKDVTAVAPLLDQLTPDSSDESIEPILQSLQNDKVDLGQTFDCVASTCLLSQLLSRADQAVGEQHPRFVELLQAIRHSHIKLMLDSLNTGGTGVLITDFVSSVSLPELKTTGDLKATIKQALDARNFLHGLNPSMVSRVFEVEEEFRAQLDGIRITDPWRWITGSRVYACFAIIFKKKK